MQRIFLLRAYGDFVIAIQAIAKSDKKIMIIASDHLAPLYHALLAAEIIPPLNIEFIALGIQHGQLSFFTNKHLLSWGSLQQLKKLKAYIKANPNRYGKDYIEQEVRIAAFNFIIGHTFEAVVPAGVNVYQAYADWLDIDLEKESLQNSARFYSHSTTINTKDCIVFPDARLKKKTISTKWIAHLVKTEAGKNKQLKIARFNNQNQQELSYHNFETLINLIKSAQFIYSADSLPVHIAEALAIPHSIVYTFNGVNRFCTPFALKNKSYIEVND